jgi:pimeloyl-ACP methyl ester carboxylesterase
MAWRSVARAMESEPQVGMIAPDLRGRADSADLPGPFGIATHVADALALLDHARVARAVLVGHSMGAYIAARVAAEHPERVAGLVLADGGIPVHDLDEESAAAARAMFIGPALARHAQTFASIDAYVQFWRQHPAFRDAWNDDVEAYARHDLRGEPGAYRYVVNIDAIAEDGEEVLSDRVNRFAIDRTHTPVRLLRAPRGAFNDENALISQDDLRRFIAAHPGAEVEEIAHVNHYTLVMGDSAGPERVAAALLAATLP